MAQAPSFSGDLAGRLLSAAPRWVLGLLVVLIGVRAALLVASLANPPVATAPAGPLPQVSSRNLVDLPSILRANLFGQSVATGADAPTTTMNLKLVLVFAESDEKLGLAALGPTPTDIKVYKVGDQVPGGARLHAVYVDSVLLDRGGSIESLKMPPRANFAAAAPPPMAGPAPTASVERVQQIMRDRPDLLAQVMTRQAVIADGKLRGVRVYPGSREQAFTRLGLRPADLITAINGTPLDDQARSNEIFNSLGSAAEARVTVQRNGREQDLNLNLAEIANEAERLAEAPAPPSAPDAPGDAAPPVGPANPESAR